MIKYDSLWNYIKENGCNILNISFDDIEKIISFPIDHSFLVCKKELLQYGYSVKKISMKNRNITFEKLS